MFCIVVESLLAAVRFLLQSSVRLSTVYYVMDDRRQRLTYSTMSVRQFFQHRILNKSLLIPIEPYISNKFTKLAAVFVYFRAIKYRRLYPPGPSIKPGAC